MIQKLPFHPSNFYLLRENIEEKKVYEKYIGSPEQVIYDFSLLPGDTFFYNSSYLILDSITNYVDNPLDCFPEATPL